MDAGRRALDIKDVFSENDPQSHEAGQGERCAIMIHPPLLFDRILNGYRGGSPGM